MPEEIGDEEGVKESALEKVVRAEESRAAAADEERSSGEKGDVPYSRFSEVNREKNEYRDKFNEIFEKAQDLEEALNERNALITRIQAMAADDRLAKHVIAIDKALRGQFDDLEEELENLETEESSDDDKSADKKTSDVDVKKLLSKQKEELSDVLAYQRAEQLHALASDRASRYLEALPDDYTDADREVLAELWNNRVNWDAIDDDASQLDPELARSFEETLVAYGTPRGATKDVIEDEKETEKEPELTDAELLSAIKGMDFSKMKGDSGFDPEVSDEDFSGLLGDYLKMQNANRGK